MKDQLVPLLKAKVGLDHEKAEQTVDAVLNYLRDNPQQVSAEVETFRLGGFASRVGGLFS